MCSTLTDSSTETDTNKSPISCNITPYLKGWGGHRTNLIKMSIEVKISMKIVNIIKRDSLSLHPYTYKNGKKRGYNAIFRGRRLVTFEVEPIVDLHMQISQWVSSFFPVDNYFLLSNENVNQNVKKWRTSIMMQLSCIYICKQKNAGEQKLSINYNIIPMSRCQTLVPMIYQ